MAGFIRGILWGGVVAVGGLLVISQLAPPVRLPAPDAAPVDVANTPEAPEAEATSPDGAPSSADPPAEAVADPVAEPVGDPVAEAPGGAPAASAGQASAPEAAPETTLSAPAPAVDAEAPSGQDIAAPEQRPQVPGAEASEAPVASGGAGLALPAGADGAVAAPAVPAQAPEPPPSSAPESSLAQAVTPGGDLPPGAGGTIAVETADPPLAVQPDAPALPQGEPAPDAAELPPPPPLTPAEEALLQPVPPADTAPPVIRLVPGEPAPSAPAPRPGLSNTAEGVITGRLPRIGDAPAESAAPAPDEAAEAEPALDPADDPSLPPVQRYARPFENPEQKPLFALLLEDKGAEVDRAALAAMAIPLTVVIDPLSEGAADRAAIWRAAGQEVVLSASGLPAGATPGDVEQIFQALSSRMPEAVAVIDSSGSEFQGNRSLAAQIVPILAEQGRGLVTFDQGLNAADQVARREGLASATVFRRFDLDNASGPAVKRYLDRAVFRAAQEGEVAVIGELRPEIVAGLLEWTVEGRASTVALAPITALLSR